MRALGGAQILQLVPSTDLRNPRCLWPTASSIHSLGFGVFRERQLPHPMHAVSSNWVMAAKLNAGVLEPLGGMFTRRALGACPARYLCITYLISSPKFVFTRGNPPSRPHKTANLPCKAPCISRNMRIQLHKKSLPPLPTTTLSIVINWVQRMGQIFRHSEKVLQIVW